MRLEASRAVGRTSGICRSRRGANAGVDAPSEPGDIPARGAGARQSTVCSIRLSAEGRDPLGQISDLGSPVRSRLKVERVLRLFQILPGDFELRLEIGQELFRGVDDHLARVWCAAMVTAGCAMSTYHLAQTAAETVKQRKSVRRKFQSQVARHERHVPW